MAWGDISLESTSWVAVQNQAIFMQDQNGDILFTQDGKPVMIQGGTSVEWEDIT